MNGDKSPDYDSPIDLGNINMRISAFNIDKSKKWDFFIPQAISCNNEADDCPGKIIYDHSRAVDKTPIIGADGTIYSGNDAKSFIGISPDSSIKWIADKMSGITVDEWDHSPSISKDGTLYVGPAGGGSGGLYAFNDNLKSVVVDENNSNNDKIEVKNDNYNTKLNQNCSVENEKGKTCDFKDKCSSNELVDGCCINGECLN